MKSLQEDIKNQSFSRVYLFCGPEAYLKQQYKNKMRAALLPEDDSMNYSYFEGKKVAPGEVIALAETMPFFADRRVIILQNTGFFKNQCQELADYLGEGLPEYLCMIFVEEEIDKRSRMYKAVKKQGRIVEFGIQDSKTLMRWVLGILKKEGKNITQKDMELFLSKTGSDMGNIEREAEKLLCYTMDRDVITADDIEAICTTQTTNKIFDMIRAVTEKNQKKALDLYYDLLSLKEPPMRILFLLARQFNLILQVKELQNQGYDNQGIGKKTGLQHFVVRNYLSYARQYTSEQLRSTVEECVKAEEDVKTGRIGDVMSVELLLVKFSGN
ncbi:DNA polymerase III subunit delta [Lactonifactor longoviformis]|uniref:DNA polymerase III subunit delta n=1 Tax=Lactonifactor longoviformis DSM 17459 TaxID=1122155 RepID=A0A1M5AX23_9CLOT|nr:DNA polymerase III subunit delta [Lactonifactor longoviformis]POP32693.1 DNA polymerase III subunit delta [Lactonifactor longoviformis]SHF34775.1 DNA polymerase III, delta subunit [Lactonifactor longoviformis DSM 17459]